ncbi:MAG: hypothetical protein PUF10_02730 [Bacteroidales bacterium]|nr:hypothetical protein [Bacteroidales bacterium]
MNIKNPWGKCNPILDYTVLRKMQKNGCSKENIANVIFAILDFWEAGCPKNYDCGLKGIEGMAFDDMMPLLKNGINKYFARKPDENPNRNNITDESDQYQDNITQASDINQGPITDESKLTNIEYRIENREDIEEKDDDENNAHAREKFSSSSSSLKDFYSLCEEMKSGSKFSEEVRMLNPLYNVSDEKYDDWVMKFMQYKKLVADDGFKSRSDVRKNFINWLPSQLKKEQELSAAKEYTLPPEVQKMAVDAIKSRVTYLTDQQILEPLTAYCKKTGKNPTDVINDCIKSLDKEHIWGEVRSALLNFTNIPTMKAF